LQACISVEKYDHSTRKHVLVSDPKTFVPGKALYVDIEGAFDPAWAASKGFNPENHIILRPETAEQAIDAIAWAIEANAVDLIILDSLAQMTPSKEIEASSEEWQMGLAARMNNKACRKWMSLLMARNKFPGGGPALLIINQFRLKVGLCFGDPRTLPGGKGQEFVSSIIAYTRSGKVTEGEAEVDLGGTVHKNKTFAPKKVYSFSMGLLESSKIGKAKIDNFSTLMDGMKRGGWLTGKAKAMSLAGTAIGDEDDLKKYLVANPTATLKWWNSVVKMDCGYSS
jgi:recombination protein RecA